MRVGKHERHTKMRTTVSDQCLKKILLLTIATWLLSTTLQAQDKDGVFAIQAGYLHSYTSIKERHSGLLAKPDIYSKPGFYAGITYTKEFSDKIISRAGISYQNKGVTIQGSRSGFPIKLKFNYNYISIEPAIGFNIIKNTSLFLGSGVNFLVNKNKISDEQKARITEFGFIAQGSYRVHKVEFDLIYFKGINNYSAANRIDPFFKFVNQNWRVGVDYIF